jgi:hypothetical protein
MSSPIVIQGTPVASPQQAQQAQPSRPPSNSPHRGERQESRCNDIAFAILFYVNILAMIGVAALYGPDALEADENATADGDTSTREYDGYVYAALICCFLAIFGSIAGVAVLMCIPETLIKVALIFVVIMAGIWMVLAFLSGSLFGGVIGAIFFAISLCYARAVWPRIPFATANLVTAITAIKANWGVVMYAYFFTFLAGFWSLIWSVAFVGVLDQTEDCSDETETCTDPSYFILFILFVSYFFTHQVIQVSTGRRRHYCSPLKQASGSNKQWLIICSRFRLSFTP